MKLLPQRLSILTYHRVLAKPDPSRPQVPDAKTFAWHLATIRRWFNVLPLDQAVARLRDRTLPSRALSITFDDGYADNHDVALPLLRQYECPATFFVATGYLDGATMWNDDIIDCLAAATVTEFDLECIGLGKMPAGDLTQRQRSILSVVLALRRLPGAERAARVATLKDIYPATRNRRLMMAPEQVRGLFEAGMQIGAHTVSHPILTRQTAASARDEISASKAALESIIGEPVTGFAYPNGRPGKDYDASHVAAVRDAGYRFAVSTAWGAATADSDEFQLPRLAPWDATPARFATRIFYSAYLQKPARIAA